MSTVADKLKDFLTGAWEHIKDPSSPRIPSKEVKAKLEEQGWTFEPYYIHSLRNSIMGFNIHSKEGEVVSDYNKGPYREAYEQALTECRLEKAAAKGQGPQGPAPK